MTDRAQQTDHVISAWALARVVEVVTIFLCFQLWKAIYPSGEIASSLFSHLGMLIFAAVFFQVFSGYFASTFLLCIWPKRFSFMRWMAISLAIYLAHFGIFFLMIAYDFV